MADDKKLRVTRSVALAGVAGSGTLSLGPNLTGPRGEWHVTGLVVQTQRVIAGQLTSAGGIAPIPKFQVYLNEANPQYSLGLTYDGSFTTAQADERILPGQVLVFQWTGGAAGDIATVVLTGSVS